MKAERGSAGVVLLAVALLLTLLGAGIGAVGNYVGARLQAATAADAAALAAAPLTFASFGSSAAPVAEAAALAAANGSVLVSCTCTPDRSWEPRMVEVEVERLVRLPFLGDRRVRARSRAEFVPARLLEVAVGELLTSERVVLSPNARLDLEAGRVDPRLVGLLREASRRHVVAVGVLVTGHGKYVRGTGRVSHHHHGRAADIVAVDGEPVSADSLAARRLVEWLASLEGAFRPDEVGGPFPDLTQHPGFFSDADHTGHLHLGYGP